MAGGDHKEDSFDRTPPLSIIFYPSVQCVFIYIYIYINTRRSTDEEVVVVVVV